MIAIPLKSMGKLVCSYICTGDVSVCAECQYLVSDEWNNSRVSSFDCLHSSGYYLHKIASTFEAHEERVR